MIIIPLSQGKAALIDDEDSDMVSHFKWSVTKSGRNCYAISRVPGGNGKMILLHCLVMRFPKNNLDHINGDGLDCRKENLRAATVSQNAMNMRTCVNSKTGFRGVTIRTNTRLTKRFMAQIKVNGKTFFLGDFETAIGAAKAYNEASHKFFGEFGRRNLIPHGH